MFNLRFNLLLNTLGLGVQVKNTTLQSTLCRVYRGVDAKDKFSSGQSLH